MILIISSIPSFQMSTVNPFPALTAPHQLIFLSKLSIIDEVALDSNLGKISSVKRRPKFKVFLLKLPITLSTTLSSILSRYLPD